MNTLRVGDFAPDFTLRAVNGGVKIRVPLSDYRDTKNVVLAFHPLNWTDVSQSQIVAYQRDLESFAAYDAQVLAISVDSIVGITAWEKAIGPIDFPLCSDFYPHGDVAKRYRLFCKEPPHQGVSARAVSVLDKAGRIRFVKVYGWDELPDNEECFQVLKRLQLQGAA
ncbi:MAG TPA: redoxin domain-containing protein [Clostridia bacterium]|nr:redoxin domain-containing protein [Clostridia bacterium]